MRETFLSFVSPAMNSSFALANARLPLKNDIAVHLSFQRSDDIVLALRDCESTQGEKAFCILFPADILGCYG